MTMEGGDGDAKARKLREAWAENGSQVNEIQP
jgi:hypothetical protein